MNMKRVHANHIIAELTRRLADRDEELDKHLCRIHKLEEDAEDDCSCIENQRVEITRLKALCQESRATAIEDCVSIFLQQHERVRQANLPKRCCCELLRYR